MAYTDIFSTEAKRMFSPPNGGAPQMIPDYWKETPDSEPRTDLQNLSDAELNALGWKGPIEYIFPDFYTQDVVWNRETREWNLVETDQSIREKRINYQEFWNKLIITNAYNTIKTLARQSLEVNAIATEFIALITDAKNENGNIDKIQEVLFEIVNNVSFTQEELTEIQSAFIDSGMYSVYTLEPSST